MTRNLAKRTHSANLLRSKREAIIYHKKVSDPIM